MSGPFSRQFSPQFGGISQSQAAACLADALQKLHDFQTGRLAVEVEVDGRKVRFNRTNIDELRAYIAELQAFVANKPICYGAIGVVL